MSRALKARGGHDPGHDGIWTGPGSRGALGRLGVGSPLGQRQGRGPAHQHAAGLRGGGLRGAPAREGEVPARQFPVQLRIDFARDAGGASIDTRELGRLARLSRNWSRTIPPATFDGLLNATGVVRGASRTGQAVDEAAQKELLAEPRCGAGHADTRRG